MPHAVLPEQDPASSPDVLIPDAPGQGAIEDKQDAPTADTEMDVDMEPSGNDKAQAVTKSLEDMFDDDDDDSVDDFSSSAPTRPNDSPNPQAAPQAKFSDTETLRQFYQRLCPFRHLFQWLNHAATPQEDFINREFSLWFDVNGEHKVARYQSFPTADLWRRECVQKPPIRFEVGPQYTMNPKDRKTLKKASAFKPIAKELVFDIDMTDYDPIRTCCSGAKICMKCWQFIVMAVKVIDAALREDFGFEQILWVYSGRRGAHAWISDKRAREMDDSKRKAITHYLEVIRGSDFGKPMRLRRPLHPHVERSLNILTPYFLDEVLAEQDPWQSADRTEKLLELLPDKKLTDALRKKWDASAGRSSNQKWEDINSVAAADNLSTLSTAQLKDVRQDIRLQYTYPRIDVEVSKKLNHLLKSPFVIHPGTGRVCVPIDVRKLEEFNPLTVPTVTQLLNEIDQWDGEKGASMSSEEKEKTQDWQKTSLKPYVEYFRGYVASLLKEESKGKREREDDGMDF